LKNISLKVKDDNCKVISDPNNPDVHHIEALLSFTEAAKLVRGNANVRPPSENRKPFKAMLNTVEFAPRSFHLCNRGITYLTSRARYDKTSGTLTIPGEADEQLDKWGIADGGHTFEVIRQVLESIDDYKEVTNWTMPLVQVKFIITEKPHYLESIVEGRNTSSQVQQYTLDNYNDKFADLKKALELVGFNSELVAYRENEDKPWHVVEIIQRLACFLRERWIRLQPTAMYKSKAKALRLYTNPTTHHEFDPLMGSVLRDIITLPEFIQAEFSRGALVKNRKFGRLKSTDPLSKPWTREGTAFTTNHKMDMAILLPMAAAFRELLELKRGEYRWRLPYKAVFRECAKELYEVLTEHTSRARLGSHVSSDADYWGACLHTVMRTKEQLIDRGSRLGKDDEATPLDAEA
jgi:hypothetical protein